MTTISESPSTAAGDRSSASLAFRLANFATQLELSDLPPTVTEAAKLHLLDALGVGLAAASVRTRPRIERAVRVLGAGTEATGLGLNHRLPAPSAALLNGSLIHALEFDDTHMGAVVHASAVVAPTALAVAERDRRSGSELIAAYVAGWEALARIGLAAPSAFHARGFQSTAVAGAPVAALVAGQVAGLDAATLTKAMGIAGSQAAGIFEFVSDGSTVKMMHGGWPAHAGIVAVALAAEGLTGPATVFEGQRGVLEAFTGDADCARRFEHFLGDLGSRWLIEEVSFKPYPCCHYIQAALEGLANVMQRGVDATDVKSIVCELPEEVAWLVCEPWSTKLEPPSGHVAKFSLPYCLAAMLVDGNVDVGTFDRAEPDPRLRKMSERVRYRPMARSGFPKRYAARVLVETKTGDRHDSEVLDVHGSVRRPFSAADVVAKFKRNAERVLTVDAAEHVVEAVWALDAEDSLDRLQVALQGLRAGE